jgi:OOP family OmpA-OmpF porin
MFAINFKFTIMKKLFLTSILACALSSVNAQTETETSTETAFNKWSIEVNGGVNKATGALTDGYFTAAASPFTIDLGTRYMFNNKFGLKLDVGYINIESKEKSLPFKTQYTRANIQGVANFGRILNFDEFTKHFNILLHTGIGYAQMRESKKPYTDKVANFMVGLTGQLKLSNRIALNLDVTSLTNFSQDITFDGNTDLARREGFVGGIFTGTLGLTFYLGKNMEHADWYFNNDKIQEQIEALKKKVADVETLMNDTDKDGVPDYLDTEPNTMPGIDVNTKGIAVDKNNNGVPDEIESYMNNTYGPGGTTTGNTYVSNNELIKNLINEGYVTVYFDYNKSVPTNISTEGIDFILTYLRNNPEASVEIIGHADELGRTSYNDKLSSARANNVKNVLLKAKISDARLNIVAAGEDDSVEKDSDLARKLVRRVTFKVK